MERLTRKLKDSSKNSGFGYIGDTGVTSQDIMNKLGNYEDLEEQGLLLRLPVAEGSTVFVIDYCFDCKYDYECPLSFSSGAYQCDDDIRCEYEYKEYYAKEAKFNYHMIDKIGETVFLTKEEAEQKLEKIQNK